MRRAGTPSTSAISAPATVAAAMETNRSTFQCSIRLPAITAPTPTNANCPRLIWPFQPVRTTRLRATIPQIAATLSFCRSAGPTQTGAITAAPQPSTTRVVSAPRISGSRLMARGIGRAIAVSCHVASPSCARDFEVRCSSRAARITTSSTTSERVGALVFHRVTWSMAPRASAAPHATGSDSIRAMIAAASAGSRIAGPVPAVGGVPTNGPFRRNVRVASPPPTAHTRRWMRRTGIPSSRARSAFSAAARIAMPAAERFRNQASAATTIGTTARIRRWLPSMTVVPTSKLVLLRGVS